LDAINAVGWKRDGQPSLIDNNVELGEEAFQPITVSVLELQASRVASL
jgi:hypothetical protein